jgi:predicted transposase YdaD
VDTYLRLNVQEEQVFQEAVGTLEGTEREGIMQIVTSWMEQGIAEGEQRGRIEGERSLILRLLARRVGTLPATVEAQVQALAVPQLEALGEALLNFAGLDDLTGWLQGQ